LAMGSVVVVLSCSAKILSTLLVSFYENVPARDGFSLGIVLNTKGILAILILQLGNSGEVISLSLSHTSKFYMFCYYHKLMPWFTNVDIS
jgi:Kef-type K+ transport system membrane component KefB